MRHAMSTAAGNADVAPPRPTMIPEGAGGGNEATRASAKERVIGHGGVRQQGRRLPFGRVDLNAAGRGSSSSAQQAPSAAWKKSLSSSKEGKQQQRQSKRASSTSLPSSLSPPNLESLPTFHSDDGTTETTGTTETMRSAASAEIIDGIFRKRAEEARSTFWASTAAQDDDDDDDDGGFGSMLSLKRANPVYDSEDEDGCYGRYEDLSSPLKKLRSSDDDRRYRYGGSAATEDCREADEACSHEEDGPARTPPSSETSLSFAPAGQSYYLPMSMWGTGGGILSDTDDESEPPSSVDRDESEDEDCEDCRGEPVFWTERCASAISSAEEARELIIH